jgi:hypothetical protein
LLSRRRVGSVAAIEDETKVEDDMSPLRRHMCLDWRGRGTIPVRRLSTLLVARLPGPFSFLSSSTPFVRGYRNG